EALEGGDGEVLQKRGVRGGGDYVLVAEHHCGGEARVLNQAHPRGQDDAPGGLGAGEGAPQIEGNLRQQGFEPVPGDLEAEPDEVCPDGTKILLDQFVESGEGLGAVRVIEGDDGAVDEHDLQREDVVAGAPVAHGPRVAGV